MKMYAKDIDWYVDMDEIYGKLDGMKSENAAAALEISAALYSNMTTDERHDYAYDYFRHRPGAMQDFVGLPNDVEIPNEIWAITKGDEGYITDWLAETFGYFINGYELEHTD